MISNKSYEILARTCHEANRAICRFYNEDMVAWNDVDQWQRESTIHSISEIIENPTITPSDLHDRWVDNKKKEGWVHGDEKDPEKKTHPCIIPYEQLPEYQRLKDHMFHAIVKSFMN